MLQISRAAPDGAALRDFRRLALDRLRLELGELGLLFE